VDFTIDGEPVRSVGQAPEYPMQMMIAVFDFPERPGPDLVPEFCVDRVRATERDNGGPTTRRPGVP
jgi:hypothetical protein